MSGAPSHDGPSAGRGRPGGATLSPPSPGTLPPSPEPALTEEELGRLWEGLRFPPEALATRDGQRLRVVYRGRRGAGPGPDFRDAVIAAGGEVRRGDVELHRRASGFRHHHHHEDHRYDHVILHVVFEDDEGRDTPLACGRRAPVVALAPWVARRSGQLAYWLAQPALWAEPCRSAAERLGDENVVELIGRLGDLRFQEKQRRFAAALASEGPDQALYAGLLTALGYSQNQEAFAALARLLSYRRLRQALAASSPRSRVVAAEALLLGSAGLLPSQHPCATPPPPYVADLERRWRRLSNLALPEGGEPTPWMWKMEGLRPDNHPVRRTAGAARLLLRAEEGIFRYLLASLEPAADENGLRPLIEAWTAPAEGFWCCHHDLLRPASRPPGALIGRGRALEILVNAVLPLAVAWGEREGDGSLARRSLALYRRLPSPGAYGATAFLRKNLRRARSRTAPSYARYQQGLLHIFRNYCTQGGCGRCPLS